MPPFLSLPANLPHGSSAFSHQPPTGRAWAGPLIAMAFIPAAALIGAGLAVGRLDMALEGLEWYLFRDTGVPAFQSRLRPQRRFPEWSRYPLRAGCPRIPRRREAEPKERPTSHFRKN
ncbi:DUF389 domain-containing protein [Hymenobacter qilianensis]|uniref:DUF389 domain-containing protein n=1 Tax=Hymenobacter qilianensis TaxID=1385715 RepID=UPI0035715022